MKNKTLILTIVVAMIAVVFSGCKKGEDDPFLSFRSRNARIIGEWIINTMSQTTTTVDETNSTNTVNSDYSHSKNTEIETVTISGNKKTEVINTTEIDESRSTNYDFVDEEFVTTTVTTENHTVVTNHYTYKLNLEIKEDGTYQADYSETLLSSEAVVEYTDENGVITKTKNDTVYMYPNTDVWTQKGDWVWNDSEKPKIIINAGPMQGSLTRLANEEVVAEDSYSHSNSSTDNYITMLETYADTEDPYEVDEGILTTVSKYTYSGISNQEWQPK